MTSDGSRIRYRYNQAGEQTAVIDQNGTTRLFARDSQGRLLTDSVQLPLVSGSLVDTTAATTRNTYDTSGRVLTTEMLNASNATLNKVTYEYDELGGVKALKQVAGYVGSGGGGGALGDERIVRYDLKSYPWLASPSGVGGVYQNNWRGVMGVSYPDGTPSSTSDDTELRYYPDADRVNELSSAATDAHHRFAIVQPKMLALRHAGAFAPTSGTSFTPTTANPSGVKLVANVHRLGMGRTASMSLDVPQVHLDRIRSVTGKTANGIYYGWDRFGRLKQQVWALTPPAAPDAAGVSGQRALTQAAQNGINARSRQFGYDDLDRLVASHSGALNSSFAAMPGSAAYPTVRSERWKLDKLGNWSGEGAIDSAQSDPCIVSSTTIPVGFSGPGVHTTDCPGCLIQPDNDEHPPGHSVTIDEAGDSPSSLLWEYHITEKSVAHSAEASAAIFSPQPNAIKTVVNVSGTSRAWRKQYTDPCGNLTFDGEYFYQYDAWNRLVQVNRSGNLTWWRFNKWGMPQDLEPGFTRPSSCCDPAELGELVKHQTYDGVGRVIRTSSPLEAPDGWQFQGDESGGTTQVPTFTRSERFFYDGTRCVQEVVTDPVVVDLEGNPVASMGSESGQRGGGGSGGGGSTGEPPMLKAVLRAQYVWGPGDGINGADELLCHLDPRDTSSSSYAAGGGKPYYPLTDAQGDVVALVHVPLVGFESNPPVAEVVGQWTYSPYGEVLSYEQFYPHPALVYGHKTLRADRIDGEALTWEYDGEDPESMAATGTFFETRRLEPGARLLAVSETAGDVGACPGG